MSPHNLEMEDSAQPDLLNAGQKLGDATEVGAYMLAGQRIRGEIPRRIAQGGTDDVRQATEDQEDGSRTWKD